MISFEVLLRCTEGHKHLIHSLMGSYVCPHPWGGFPRSIYGPLPACRKAPSVPLQVTTLPTFLTWRSLSCFGTLHKWHHCSLASFTQLSAWLSDSRMYIKIAPLLTGLQHPWWASVGTIPVFASHCRLGWRELLFHFYWQGNVSMEGLSDQVVRQNPEARNEHLGIMDSRVWCPNPCSFLLADLLWILDFGIGDNSHKALLNVSATLYAMINISFGDDDDQGDHINSIGPCVNGGEAKRNKTDMVLGPVALIAWCGRHIINT